MKFNPWDEASSLPAHSDISHIVKGPPCVGCKFWKPVRDEEESEDCEGITLCHSENQFHDFSCYREIMKEKEIPARVSFVDWHRKYYCCEYNGVNPSHKDAFHANDARLDYLEKQNQKLQRDIELQDEQNLIRQNQIVAKLERKCEELQQKYDHAKVKWDLNDASATRFHTKCEEQAKVIEKLTSGLDLIARNGGQNLMTVIDVIPEEVAKHILNDLKSEGK